MNCSINECGEWKTGLFLSIDSICGSESKGNKEESEQRNWNEAKSTSNATTTPCTVKSGRPQSSALASTVPSCGTCELES